MSEAAKMKMVTVKFGAVKPGHEHSHDGKVCQAGEVMALPEDLAAFVIANGKAEAHAEEAGASSN